VIEAFKAARLLGELRKGSRMPLEAQRDLQSALLQKAVAHAERNVPFYRRVWKEAGVDPAGIRSIDDLARLPIIASDTVRAAAENGELLATGTPTDLPRFPSGGSTGNPLQVPRGDVEARLWRAGGLRIQLEHGFRWWNTTVQFGPAPGPPHPLQKFGIAPTVWISDETPIDDQIYRLKVARGSFVFGHITALRSIGLAILERGEKISPPKVVFSLAEVLDDDSRATIRNGFGVPPTDVYGMTEMGYIAWQCERREALHMNADTLVVEILRGDGAARPGEIGRVVVTNLRARTMPLLRYETGDLAEAVGEPCGCGRTLPTMGPIEGRERHVIEGNDGRVLTQRAVLNRLAGTLRMGEYQLRRKSENRFILEATARAFATDAGEDDARRIVRELFGNVDLEILSRNGFPWKLKTHAFIDESGLSKDASVAVAPAGSTR
jgi:phenylacetate-CoA ligase